MNHSAGACGSSDQPKGLERCVIFFWFTRRLANREAARRMRRRRATHMAAVEEEVERLSQENSLLLHRMSQLVASHQAVDAENAQLRADLMTLRASVVSVPSSSTPAYRNTE